VRDLGRVIEGGDGLFDFVIDRITDDIADLSANLVTDVFLRGK
jgi:hypothetical protein